ncbi:extracellular solute-binding protein [Salinibacterium sp. G-O1]|uniref:ABC transporter substrate-binding protein n=1 Tax=Salinibacterium sp. G-O1 TaxID=3046208 RepID=UPI0024B927F5|nr:extracellular solute-binding protein [Salinibacterium sp. G-O1]MDJ0334921.1 extracellular solute-binding protein [Salinibacterium sp. G-O1]
MKKKLARKLLTMTGVLTAATIAITGCASATPAVAEDTTVTIWSWRTNDVAAFEELAALYNEENPNVTLDFRTFKAEEYQQILATGLSASKGPDLLHVKSYGVIEQFAEAGSLEPLDEIVPGIADYSDNVLAGTKNRQDGLVYGIPFSIQTMQVFYNKTIFDELGLSVPTTYDEFIEVCDALKAAGITPLVTGGDNVPQLSLVADTLGSARRGGADFEKAFLAGKTDLSDPDYVASLEIMKELQPYFPESIVGTSNEEARTLIFTGAAAMLPSGAWEVQGLRDNAPDYEFGIFDMPVDSSWPSAKPVTPGYVDGGWAMSTRAENKEVATEVLNWFAGLEFSQRYSDLTALMPALDTVVVSDPLVQEAFDAYTDHGVNYFGSANLRYGTPSGTDLMGEAVQKMWLGQEDAKAAAANIQRGIDQWYVPVKN